MIPNPEAAEKKEFDLADFDAVIFSDAADRRRLSRKVRVFAGTVVVLAHVGFWWILQWISRPDIPQDADDNALLVDFITRSPAKKKIPETGPLVAATARVRVAEPKPASGRMNVGVQPKPQPQRSTRASVARTAIQLYNDDGSVHVSADVLTDLEKLRSDERSFDFQQPGLELAAKLLQHRSPLEYQATRFDKDWRPNQDLLTELLTRAVEATTKEIRIPIPGDPRHHLVCKVSFLAMGGGCGIESNGDPDALLPGHDDPNTLSAEEDRACRAWWEKIITAKTQDEWRQTRKLYEQECRKPLARDPVMP